MISELSQTGWGLATANCDREEHLDMPSIEDRISHLLDQLQISTLTVSEVQTIEKKIEFLKGLVA